MAFHFAAAAMHQMLHGKSSRMLLSVYSLIATLTIHEAAALAPDPGPMIPVAIRPATRGDTLFTAQSFELRTNVSSCSMYPEGGQSTGMCTRPRC